jgi:DNA invertase Pin-like site-specific DNA recombinase
MSVIGYARCEDERDHMAAVNEMHCWCIEQLKGGYMAAFDWDGQSGQRGLQHTLKGLKSGDRLLIRHLSDLGRDLHELVRNAHELLVDRRVDVTVTSTRLDLSPGAEEPDTRVLSALFDAHNRYVQENRRRGIETARAGGATIGRPPRADLTPDRVRKAIGDLIDATTGRLPTVRKLAEALSCGTFKAGQLLKQHRDNGEQTK